MKKIVGILGMAAVLGSMAFAAEPAANFVMSEFTGSAEFGVKADFTKDDALFGMYNDGSANLKFGFVTAGDKTTTGDGVWGELKIKADASDATAIPKAAIDTAKIHFVDGDFSLALNIINPTLKYGGFTPASATPIDAKKTLVAATDTNKTAREALTKLIGDAKSGLTKDVDDAKKKYDSETTLDNYKAWKELESMLNTAKAELAKVPAAPAAGSKTLATTGIGDDTGLANGFKVEMKMNDLFAFNVIFKDMGPTVAAKNQKYGLAFDASLLAVKDLEASVAMSMNFGTKYTGLQAKAAYNFAINDKLYVKPAVTYEMEKKGDADPTNALAAGLLFGWGAKDSEQTLDYFGKYKYNEGVSVALCPIFSKDNTEFLMTVGLYDQSLLSLLGLEDFGTLKSAFGFDTFIWKDNASNTIRAALAYDVTFSPVYFSTHFGMEAKMANKDAKFEPSVKFGVKLGSKEVIDNTDLYVSYEMEKKAADKNKPSTNSLTIGSKISF